MPGLLGEAWRLLPPREGPSCRHILCLGWAWVDGVSYRRLSSRAVVCVHKYFGVHDGRNGWCGLLLVLYKLVQVWISRR